MMFSLLILAAVFVLIIIMAVYQKITNASFTSERRLDGKTALVTGGTAGMGLEIAKDLAKRGARVIVCCPFEEEGINGREEIVKASGNENVVFQLMDLASLSSVRSFAQEILKTEDRLDILVNNAGVSTPPDPLTADGLNYIIQVNYFGHFLLTNLLLPLLKKSAPSRIVNTSSVAHRFVAFKIDHLCTHDHNWLSRQWVYAKSKFCVIPFANELTKRLAGSQFTTTPVVVNCVDPGAVGTGIFRDTKFFGNLLKWYFKSSFKTPKEGAQTAIYVAVDESLGSVSGKYFQNCKEGWSVPWANGDKLAKQLWEESARLVKLTDEEMMASRTIHE